jgi:hypothetical protein
LKRSNPRKPKPKNIEVVETGGQRVVVTTYTDAEVVETLVDPNALPTRKPHKPFVRVLENHPTRTRTRDSVRKLGSSAMAQATV